MSSVERKGQRGRRCESENPQPFVVHEDESQSSILSPTQGSYEPELDRFAVGIIFAVFRNVNDDVVNDLNLIRSLVLKSFPCMAHPACSTISVTSFPLTTRLFICSGTGLSSKSPSSPVGTEILIELVLLVMISTTSIQA